MDFKKIGEDFKNKQEQYKNELKKEIQKIFLELKNEITTIDLISMEFYLDMEGGNTYLDEKILNIDHKKMNVILTDNNIDIKDYENQPRIDFEEKTGNYRVRFTYEDCVEEYTEDKEYYAYLFSLLLGKNGINLLHSFMYDFLESLDANDVPLELTGKWE